jgi:hypothetical protein
MKLIAFTGAAGCGKDTAASVLIDQLSYEKISFASAIKDAISIIFGWDRHMLEGATKESRAWREEPDEWWSTRLGRNTTPRSVLQQWGTELGRETFHKDIWIAAIERKIAQNPDKKYVLTDCRFANEAEMVSRAGGKIINITRKGVELTGSHQSEVGLPSDMFDMVIDNDGSLDEFIEKINDFCICNL